MRLNEEVGKELLIGRFSYLLMRRRQINVMRRRVSSHGRALVIGKNISNNPRSGLPYIKLAEFRQTNNRKWRFSQSIL